MVRGFLFSNATALQITLYLNDMFTNEHLDLHPLRRKKINLGTKLTEGDYKGKTIKELLLLDLDYVTHLGDNVDNNWTWPVLKLWTRLKKLKSSIPTKNAPKKKKVLYKKGKMFFGKYKGQKVFTIMKKDPSYIKWLKTKNFEIV